MTAEQLFQIVEKISQEFHGDKALGYYMPIKRKVLQEFYELIKEEEVGERSET